MKKYILFDHDGVLVDTEYWYFTANQQALAEINIELDLFSYLKNMSNGISCWHFARAAGVDESIISIQRDKRNQYYQHYLQHEDIEIPGVEAVLQDLAKDYEMAIVTTSKQSDFDLIHKNRNIIQHMSFILTRNDYKNAKPDAEPYLCALAKFNAKKTDVLIVEDSERGLKSAVAAGIDCAVVANEFTRSHDFSTATYRIESLAELRHILTR